MTFLAELKRREITKNIYGLDFFKTSDGKEDNRTLGRKFKLKIPEERLFQQSYLEPIKGKYDLILFHAAIYPRLLSKEDFVEALKNMVVKNLNKNGEIRIHGPSEKDLKYYDYPGYEVLNNWWKDFHQKIDKTELEIQRKNIGLHTSVLVIKR